MGACERCGSVTVASCLCSSISSSNIAQSGSGSAGSPFSYELIFDPAADNQARDDGNGLYVPSDSPYCTAYNNVSPALRSVGDNIDFPTTIHDDGVKTGDGTFQITEIGLWEVVAQVEVIRDTDNPFTEVYLGLYDFTNGNWQSKSGPHKWPAYANTNTFIPVAKTFYAGVVGVEYQIVVRAIDGVTSFGSGGPINIDNGAENTFIYFGKRRP